MEFIKFEILGAVQMVTPSGFVAMEDGGILSFTLKRLRSFKCIDMSGYPSSMPSSLY